MRQALLVNSGNNYDFRLPKQLGKFLFGLLKPFADVVALSLPLAQSSSIALLGDVHQLLNLGHKLDNLRVCGSIAIRG